MANFIFGSQSSYVPNRKLVGHPSNGIPSVGKEDRESGNHGVTLQSKLEDSFCQANYSLKTWKRDFEFITQRSSSGILGWPADHESENPTQSA